MTITIGSVRRKIRTGQAITEEERRFVREYENRYRRGRRIVLMPSLAEKEEIRSAAAENGEPMSTHVLHHALRAIRTPIVDPVEHERLQASIAELVSQHQALTIKVGDDQIQIARLRNRVEELTEEIVRLANAIEDDMIPKHARSVQQYVYFWTRVGTMIDKVLGDRDSDGNPMDAVMSAIGTAIEQLRDAQMSGRYPRKHVNVPAHVVDYIDRVIKGKVPGITATQAHGMFGAGRDSFVRVAVALLAASLELEGEDETILDRYQRLVSLTLESAPIRGFEAADSGESAREGQ